MVVDVDVLLYLDLAWHKRKWQGRNGRSSKRRYTNLQIWHVIIWYSKYLVGISSLTTSWHSTYSVLLPYRLFVNASSFPAEGLLIRNPNKSCIVKTRSVAVAQGDRQKRSILVQIKDGDIVISSCKSLFPMMKCSHRGSMVRAELNSQFPINSYILH